MLFERAACLAIAATVLLTNCIKATAASTRLVSAAPHSGDAPGEAGANTLSEPEQILRTGIDLNTVALSPLSFQLAGALQLTPLLQKIERLRSAAAGSGSGPLTLEKLATKQDLTEAIVEAQQIIQQADLAVDFTVAEIAAEQSLYQELLSNYQAQANRAMQWSNWASYYSNGVLWSVGEALAIPSAKRPKYAISSGIFGIAAGAAPSLFSLYAMHAAGGRKHPSHCDPNMLTKLFGMKPDLEDEYPSQVWAYLSAVPAGDKSNKNRRDQLIDRWVADNNIRDFTDRSSQKQINLVAATVESKNGLTITLLQTRQTMLSQLAAEVLKMKRLLLELSMTVHGEKHV